MQAAAVSIPTFLNIFDYQEGIFRFTEIGKVFLQEHYKALTGEDIPHRGMLHIWDEAYGESLANAFHLYLSRHDAFNAEVANNFACLYIRLVLRPGEDAAGIQQGFNKRLLEMGSAAVPTVCGGQDFPTLVERVKRAAETQIETIRGWESAENYDWNAFHWRRDHAVRTALLATLGFDLPALAGEVAMRIITLSEHEAGMAEAAARNARAELDLYYERRVDGIKGPRSMIIDDTKPCLREHVCFVTGQDIPKRGMLWCSKEDDINYGRVLGGIFQQYAENYRRGLAAEERNLFLINNLFCLYCVFVARPTGGITEHIQGGMFSALSPATSAMKDAEVCQNIRWYQLLTAFAAVVRTQKKDVTIAMVPHSGVKLAERLSKAIQDQLRPESTVGGVYAAVAPLSGAHEEVAARAPSTSPSASPV